MTFDPTVPLVQRFGESRLHWDLLKESPKEGYRRGIYSGVTASSCTANVIVICPGQHTPRHSWRGEHIIVQLEGETHFAVDGHEPQTLRPFDLMFLPANLPYRYENLQSIDSRFVSVVGRLDEWPTGGDYLE